MDQQLISLIVEEILKRLQTPDQTAGSGCGVCRDIVSPECKAVPLLEAAEDPEALLRMKKRTTARIGVGKAGPRLNTQTMLTLRADHAKARDAVFADVDPKLIASLGLFTVQTTCEDKDTYVTGRTWAGSSARRPSAR